MDFFILIACGTCVLTMYVLDYKYGHVTVSDAKLWLIRWWNRINGVKQWWE